jgi:hypothetical protein
MRSILARFGARHDNQKTSFVHVMTKQGYLQRMAIIVILTKVLQLSIVTTQP